MDNIDAIAMIVDGAVDAPNGKVLCTQADAHLVGELARNQFNTERAVEVFTIAVDNAVWAHLQDLPLRRQIYADYKISGRGHEKARQLVNEFIRLTGAADQRASRRWFRSLLGA